MKRLAIFAAVLSIGGVSTISVPTAQAFEYGIRLPAKEAVRMVKRTGGSVHSCRRIGNQRFRCRATYWSILHEGVEVEPGVVVETHAEPIPEEVEVEVTLEGVSAVG